MAQDYESQFIPYSATGKFNPLILQYLDQSSDISEFYSIPPDWKGMAAAISQRADFGVDRKLLVAQLRAQYQGLESSEEVLSKIESLADDRTFTVCTAHQPNILTGHLYFIYKILHTIRLAQTLKARMPEFNFVPVYFMGSEDADFAELNHLYLDGIKYSWQTEQTGAFGRMKVDQKLERLLDEVSGRLEVEPYGKEVMALLRKCFKKGDTVEHATFLLVHALFHAYGLVVFLPDNPSFKKLMIPLFKEDLFERTPSGIVQKTISRMERKFKVQAHPREINLFYLKDGIRNRIVESGDRFVVHDTDMVFTRAEMESELEQHPERFSPNVILRALFQETALPNLAFIGGGGELSYWFELRDLFAHYQIPFPMLILRNSFLLVNEKNRRVMKKLGLSAEVLFKSKQEIVNGIVLRDARPQLNLDSELHQMRELYHVVRQKASQIDPTLVEHTEALQTMAMKKLTGLSTKLLRAERRKYEDQAGQVEKLKSNLFPGGNLQERTECYLLTMAIKGPEFLKVLFEHSLNLEQQFCVLMDS